MSNYIDRHLQCHVVVFIQRDLLNFQFDYFDRNNILNWKLGTAGQIDRTVCAGQSGRFYCSNVLTILPCQKATSPELPIYWMHFILKFHTGIGHRYILIQKSLAWLLAWLVQMFVCDSWKCRCVADCWHTHMKIWKRLAVNDFQFRDLGCKNDIQRVRRYIKILLCGHQIHREAYIPAIPHANPILWWRCVILLPSIAWKWGKMSGCRIPKSICCDIVFNWNEKPSLLIFIQLNQMESIRIYSFTFDRLRDVVTWLFCSFLAVSVVCAFYMTWECKACLKFKFKHIEWRLHCSIHCMKGKLRHSNAVNYCSRS